MTTFFLPASSCYCLLFKLGTLKLSKKQVYLLMDHGDSPYIRAMGFMYVRYMMDPATFWDWFEPYLSDEEEIDVKAGGGKNMTIGKEKGCKMYVEIVLVTVTFVSPNGDFNNADFLLPSR